MRRCFLPTPPWGGWLLPVLALLFMIPAVADAQGMARSVTAVAGTSELHDPDAIRAELMGQFEGSMEKFIALAKAMPAESYTWAPGQGIMEVGQVFMHVARYNYMYPSANMGAALPTGVKLDGMEAERHPEQVVRALEESRAWVRASVGAMSGEDLAGETRLYGRTLPRWAVLVQLVAHMNEHLGQSIAYARMNDVVPPWSR